MLKQKNYMKIKGTERHPFHLVDPSPWPILTSISLFTMVIGFIGAIPLQSNNGDILLGLGFIIFIQTLMLWFNAIRLEAKMGHHTNAVVANMFLGMKLFILSEIMFFFSLFWAYFHFALIPNIFIGGIWPPIDTPINPLAVPLINTAILTVSGYTISWSRLNFIHGDWNLGKKTLGLTITLGILFTMLQAFEYKTLPFTIETNAFGSIFYLLTGFHGLHVIIGTIFLALIYKLIKFKQLTSKTKFVGFTCAYWYWIFVDVVWIFLYIIVYIWGGGTISFII